MAILVIYGMVNSSPVIRMISTRVAANKTRYGLINGYSFFKSLKSWALPSFFSLNMFLAEVVIFQVVLLILQRFESYMNLSNNYFER